MTVETFDHEKASDYPEQQEMYERILDLIHEYDNDMSIAASLGVVEIVKDTLMNELRGD